MENIIKQLMKLNEKECSSIYLREIALLMEENERLTERVKELTNEAD